MDVLSQKRLPGWFVLAGYFVATVFLHLKVSKFLIEPFPLFSKRVVLLDYFGPIAFVILAFLVAMVLKQFYRGERRLITCAYWFLLILTMVGADRYLLFKNIEYIHYPQYAVLAFLLGKCMDPERDRFFVGRILFWATFLGIIDEMIQYFYLCASYGDYLDFNDFFLNLQGAFAGVLVYYGFRSIPPKTQGRAGPFLWIPEALLIMVCAGAIVFLSFTGRLHISAPHPIPPGGIGHAEGRRVVYLERKPGLFGSWNKGVHRGGNYYVLRPKEGMILLSLTGVIFASFGKSPTRENA